MSENEEAQELSPDSPDYRTFPAVFEYTEDAFDGPTRVTLDLRKLSDKELETLVPENKYAYLEILHRALRKTI